MIVSNIRINELFIVKLKKFKRKYKNQQKNDSKITG